MRISSTKSLRARLTGSCALMALTAAGCVFAAGSADAQNAAVEQVVVTGSRIGTPGFTSATPVTEITPLAYEMKAVTSLDDLLFDVPSLTPSLNYNASTNVGIDTFNLRNLGASRTLVLVNNIRTEQTDAGGTFDIGTIPAGLVAHVDVVTGGASAGYGSDAVAGMVNVTLNTSLSGFKANLSGGTSQHGDEITALASLAFGTDLFGGRGHLIVGGDYYTNSGSGFETSRSWGRNSPALVTNPNCPTATTPGCFQQNIAFNVTMAKMSDGGVIVSAGPLQYLQFGAGGVTEPFVLGTFVGSTFMVGGDGAKYAAIAHIQPSQGRANILMHNSYDFSDTLSLWTEASFATDSAFFYAFPLFNNGDITITNQNAFLPASVAAVMTANKITQFLMGRANWDVGGPAYMGFYLNYGVDKDYQGSAGLKGKLDFLGGWDWDLTGQYSSNEQYSHIGQNLISANWVNAIDSVVVNGRAVCRSAAAQAAGCAPVNLFGPNTVTPAVRDYAVGTSWTDAFFTQSLAQINLRGEPFSTWAGPVSVAFGAEARRQTINSMSDPISQVSGWKNANAIPYKGALSVQEGYFETDIPLAKDMPLAAAIDVNAAVRLTSYSTSGGVSTWKVGVNYSPVDELRLRGTRSHDIRAPNLTELFQTGVLRSGGTVINPLTSVQSTIQTLTTGNPNLLPELGDTVTGGVVYSPAWADGFNISIDYWKIKVSGAVASVGAQTVVNNCYAGQTSYCPAITTNPSTGLISIVASTSFNTASLKTDGWDLEAGYNFELGDLVPGLDGTVQTSMLATYLNNYINNQLGVITNAAGCVAACAFPHLRYNLNAIYLNDPWRVSVTGNWMSGGEYNYLYSGRYTAAQGGLSINNNKVDGRFTINTTVSYQLNPVWQLYGKVQNLANVNPPLTPSASTLPFAASSSLYDRIGRTMTAGIKITL